VGSGNSIIFTHLDVSIVEYKLTTDAARAVREMHDTPLDGRTIYVRPVIIKILIHFRI
jgi:hypothetical protein